MARIEKECPMCDRSFLMEVDADRYANYLKGKGFVQDIFPELDSFEREFLKTGYCPDCQSSIFGNEYKGALIKEVHDGE